VAPSSTRLGSFLLAAVAVGSLGFVRCYSATEIVIDLRTNLPCATFQPNTQIRLGEGQILAETTTCEPSAAEEQTIGTLTFVPSADRDAKVVVEVVLAVKGVSPESCGAQPDKCIVARRAFSFIEHSSRRLPVVLRGQCLGKVCGGGETCVKGGVCVPIEVACLIEECFPETTPAGPPPPITTPDSGTAACTNGAVRCAGERLEECKDGAFELRDVCATSALCEQRSGTSCAKPVAPTCTPGEKKCDSACEISGRANGSSADDCVVACNAEGTAFAFVQNCGIAQHATFSDSCRPAPTAGGAECF
jgi:hypothetical protein